MPLSPHLGWVPATAGGDQRRRRRFPPAPPSLAVPPASPTGSEPAGEAIGGAPFFLPRMSARGHAATIWPSLDGRRAAGFVGVARPTSRRPLAKRLSWFAGFIPRSHQDDANLPPKPRQILPIDVPPPDCYGRRKSSPRRLASPFVLAPIRPFRLHALVACLSVANLARPLRLRKGRGKPSATRKL